MDRVEIRVGEKPEGLYQERENRVMCATQLKVPDRVPIYVHWDPSPCSYTGISLHKESDKSDQWFASIKEANLYFQPDMYSISAIIQDTAYKPSDDSKCNCPRHGFLTGEIQWWGKKEYMKADEYDALLDDPTDYAVTTYLPRIFGKLALLKTLPRLSSALFGSRIKEIALSLIIRPEVACALNYLLQGGREVNDWNAAARSFHMEMAASGFVLATVSSTYAPFDLIANTLRGVRGTMLDLYRQPQKLLEAMEKLLPRVIEQAISGANRSGNQRVLIPLHWGGDGYLSKKQFEIFYWPTLEKLIISLIDAGMTPYPFFEGSFDSRLKYLVKLPKGKVVGEFDATDIFRAKKIIGDTMCIIGNIPASLLQRGTVEQIKDYSRKLIDIVGEGGGFIMGLRSALNNVNPQLVKIWFEFSREYGVYR